MKLWRPLLLLLLTSSLRAVEADRDPAWSEAWRAAPMNAAETRTFIRRLTDYVLEHHLKKTEGSPQRGMIYEYFHVARAGQPDRFIQGEALDTMHDGAWFGVAMAAAARATGDPYYRRILTEWQLPFYLKMLNHSDELFSSERNDARPGTERGWQASPEWLLQGREKGFVPYWWDDGNSVSLEAAGPRRDRDESLNFPAHNDLAGQPNPVGRLSGYSLGSSNHLAQDLAVFLQDAWLLLHDPAEPAQQRLTAEIAEGARHLAECRARHGSPGIPAVQAALWVTGQDEAARRTLAPETWKSVAAGRSDYRRAFVEKQPLSLPAFADDQAYRWHIGQATGGLSEPAAFRLAYDAWTLPKLYQAYSDDAPVPPGINIFDLHPYKMADGQPLDLRSGRKGPGKGPRPIGSRFGPQHMAVCGWALRELRAHPDLFAKARAEITLPGFFPEGSDAEIKAALERELGGGLRTWEAIFQCRGYIPTGIGAGNCGAGFPWEELSDTGGYAHLINAAAQWLELMK